MQNLGGIGRVIIVGARATNPLERETVTPALKAQTSRLLSNVGSDEKCSTDVSRPLAEPSRELINVLINYLRQFR